MNETRTRTPEAVRALTSYIEEMLHIESRPPVVGPEIDRGESVAGGEWRIFDFGGLRAGLPSDRISSAGERVRAIEIEAWSSEYAWLYCAHMHERSLTVIDLQKLVMPRANSIFGRGKRPGELDLWMVRRGDLVLAVDCRVPVQLSVFKDIHRCGPDRRRKWLAGSHLETRSVFLDIEGLGAVVGSADLTRSADGPA